MVRTLNDLCLLQVCSCMIDGTLPANLQIISPLVRRKIFKILVDRQKLNDANCLKYMKELLNDDSLEVIDTIQQNSEDWSYSKRRESRAFLQLLDECFQESPDLSQRITTLRLMVKTRADEHITPASTEGLQSGLPADLRIALQLVGRCRHLKRLTLMSRFYFVTISHNYLALLADSVRQSGSAGLETLELNCNNEGYRDFQPTFDQTLAFRSLKHLLLEKCSFMAKSWSRFLDCCRKSLECLVLNNVTVSGGGDLIPVRLEKLTSFALGHSCSSLHLRNAMERCPNLKGCRFQLLQRDLTSDLVSAFKSLLPSLDQCSISLSVSQEINRFLNQLIDIAGPNITEMFLAFRPDWTADEACRLISGCPNLHTLHAINQLVDGECPAFEQSLKFLFSDHERAQKLIKMEIDGFFVTDVQTLELIFANCINLVELKIDYNNFPITDRHIEIWIDRGARPAYIDLASTAITEHGLKLLISACGSKLNGLLTDESNVADADSVIKALIHGCPMLEFIEIQPVLIRLQAECYSGFCRNFFNNLKGCSTFMEYPL